MRHAALLLTLMLAGCGASAPKLVEPPITQAPANVVVPCDPIPDPPGRGASMGQLYSFTGALIGLYGECAARDQGKLDFIKSQGH